MIKTTIITILILATATPILRASSDMASKVKEVASKKLILWHNQSPEQTTFLSEILQDFNRKKKIWVTAEGISDIAFSLTKANKSGALPDVILAPGDIVGLYQSLKFSHIPNHLKQPNAFANLDQSLSQLQGWCAPAVSWESALLAGRCGDYS